MEERIERVLKMLMDRADYYYKENLQFYDEASTAAMNAYNCAYMMLYYAQQGNNEGLNELDCYGKKE